MKIYSKNKDGGILMHSDIYLGEDYTSPNMMHWKYIRKERRNGRWYYIYDDPNEQKLKNKMVDASEEGSQHVWLIKDLKKQKKNGKIGSEYIGKGNKLESTIIKYKNGKESDDYESVSYKTIDEGIRKHTKRAIDKSKEYSKAKKEYNKYNNKFEVKIKKMAVKTLNQLSNSIYNAKKFLKKIFS